jgi:hypothetical protein
MRQILVRFILLFAVVGESSLVVLTVKPEDAPPPANCYIAGIGSASATVDRASGALRVTRTTCEGFLQQESAMNLAALTRP